MNIDSMLDDLSNRNVDIVLVDLYSMVGYKNKVKSRLLKLKTVIDTNTGYGMILSGFTQHLKLDIDGLLSLQQAELMKYTESIKDDIPSLEEEKRGDVIQLILGADSVIFQQTVLYLIITWCIMVLIGITYQTVKTVRKRWSIEPNDTTSHKIKLLQDDVDSFVRNITANINNIATRQENDIIYLSTLKDSVSRYRFKVGNDFTDQKLKKFWNLAAEKQQ